MTVDPAAPLRPGLLADLSRRGRIILCLDYDGTLAPIVDDPAQAWPDETAIRALKSLARRRDRLDIAIISGRGLAELKRLLGIDRDIFLVGVHGIETQYPDGHREPVRLCADTRGSLAAVRRWLSANVPKAGGFSVEDKEFALALHYRRANAEAARTLVASFERFVKNETPALTLKSGKMVVEAAPPTADKGIAVIRLIGHAGNGAMPVYFGDDLTDEDAFRAVASRGGVTIKVGAGATAACYTIDGPKTVGHELAELAASLAD